MSGFRPWAFAWKEMLKRPFGLPPFPLTAVGQALVTVV